MSESDVYLFAGISGDFAPNHVNKAYMEKSGYGRLIGRIAGPWLVMQSAAPLVMAFVAERFSDAAALGLACAFALVAMGCFWAIRRPE